MNAVQRYGFRYYYARKIVTFSVPSASNLLHLDSPVSDVLELGANGRYVRTHSIEVFSMPGNARHLLEHPELHILDDTEAVVYVNQPHHHVGDLAVHHVPVLLADAGHRLRHGGAALLGSGLLFHRLP